MATLHTMAAIRKGPAREEVERLAKQAGHLIAVAQKVYDAEYDKLREAEVTDFVAALALRRTRERLLALQKNRNANASYELFSA